jgi:glycosyltransferase involved in cell wall biosynthesis
MSAGREPMPGADDAPRPNRPVRPKDAAGSGWDVLVDLTALDTPSRFRGIGRYTAGLAGGLAALTAEGRLDLRVAGLTRNGFDRRPPVDPTLGYRGDPGLRPSERQYLRWKMTRRLAMGTQAARAGARLLHLIDPKGTPWDPRVPRIVTCHDLIPLVLHRDYRGPIPGIHTAQRLRELARYGGAQRLIAVSEATRRDLVQRLGLDPDRVDVVHHGVDHARFTCRREAGEAERVAALLGRDDPFLLHVGAGDRRKRLELLVRAYALSGRSREALLVLAGTLTRGQRRGLEHEARRTGVFARVVFTGFVADDLVPALYRSCLAVVFPSVYEGFGLPVLEALACGAPTLTTGATAMPEVAGDAGLTVPADDEDALADAIARLVDDSGLRRRLSEGGAAQARRFTWQRCAAETLACYRRALAESD